MHCRALCVFCSVAKTTTRCGIVYSNSRVAFGGWLLSQQFCHSSTALQSVSEDVEKGGKQVQHFASVPETFPDVWQKELQDLVDARPEEARNVFVEDLSATLEAHRAANRASVIRRLNQKANWKAPWITPKDISRPDDKSSLTEAAPTFSKDQNADTDANAAKVSAGQCVLGSKDVGVKNRKLTGRSRKASGRDGKSADRPTCRRMDLSQRRLHWPADSVQNKQATGEKYHHDTSGPMEYEAMYIGPVGEFDTERWRTRDYPWLAKLDIFVPGGRNGSALQRLNDELKAYEKFMRLAPIEREAAEIFTADVSSMVHKVLPNCPVLPIGSYSTGLADRLSDFDFSISIPDLEKAPLDRGPSPTRPKACKIRAKALLDTRVSLAKSSQFIPPVEMIYARVPIVKASHRITRFRVELQVLGSHQATQEYTMAYLAEFPTLRPLYIVFRSALHIRRLNIVHEGGLGSYSTLMMIVNALKHASSRFAQDDLASHFLYVLEFYSNADLYKYGFSPDPPRTLPKQAKLSSDQKIARLRDPVLRGMDILLKANPKKPYLLCLQDPANPVNDLGSKAYGIKHVQELFRVIREGLTINMAAWEGDGNFEKAWQPHALLAECLGAKYAGLEEQRRRVERWVNQRNDTYKNKGWRQLAIPAEEPKGQLEMPKPLDSSSGTIGGLAGMKAANGQPQVDIDNGLDGTGLNLGSVRSGSGTDDVVTTKPDFEADTSADTPATQGHPSDRSSRPLANSLPKGDETTHSTPKYTHSRSTTGDWKKWVPPTEDGMVNTEEKPSDTKDHSSISPLSQKNANVQLPKDSSCSDTKTSSWKKWSPPSKNETTEPSPPSEPTQQSESDQADPQVKADQEFKECSRHRGSPMSHLRSTTPRLSHLYQSRRRLSVLNHPILHRRTKSSDVVQARRLSEDKANADRKHKSRAQPSKSGSIQRKDAKDLEVDEDCVEQSETAASSLLTGYEAPVPNLDYFNKRERALGIKPGHAAKSEEAVPRIAKSNESARLTVPQPPVSKEQTSPSEPESGTDEAVEEFHNSLDVLMPTEEARANLLVAIKSMSLSLKTGQFLKIEAKKSPKGSPLKWYNYVRLVKGPKVDGEQVESDVDDNLAVSSRPVILDDRVTGPMAKERTSLDSLKADSETTSEQDSELYGSYRRRRKKALLQMQAKQTQLWYPIVSPPKTEDAGDATDELGVQQDIEDMKTTTRPERQDLVVSKCFRVFASKKAPHFPSGFSHSGISTGTQETPIDASGMSEPQSDGRPASKFWAKYEALETLKMERGWGKYRDPNTAIEPLPEVPRQSSLTRAPLTNAESDPKNDDFTGTAKFFHKTLSAPRNPPKRKLANNTPVTKKLNPETRPSEPKSKQASSKTQRKARLRRIQARRAGHLAKKAKKLAKKEKTREIQAKWTALREKLRRERRGGLVGYQEIKEGIEEEKRGSVKWMEEK